MAQVCDLLFCGQQQRNDARTAAEIDGAIVWRGSDEGGEKIGVRTEGQTVFLLDQAQLRVDLIQALVLTEHKRGTHQKSFLSLLAGHMQAMI